MHVEHLPKEHRFVIRHADGEAEVTYRWSDDILDILHTGVPEALGGKGVGSRIARGVLDFAREKGVKVRPYCPFIAGWIERHADYADLVAPDFKGRAR